MSDHPLDFVAIREALSRTQGKFYWRSLEELAASEHFQEFLQREFPRQAAVWDGSLSRRRFLQVMGASLALAGLSGCLSQPVEKIVPYVRAPEEVVPGQPLFFATALTLGGFATGVLVESHMGRPTKIEGNPDHPASLGAADALTQAMILSLYDPDRSQTVMQSGQPSTWDAFVTALGAELAKQAASGGAGLRVLTETVTSPTLAAQLQALLETYPAARWHQYEGAHRDNAVEGARLAFGEPVGVHYRLDQADVILSLDADFLNAGPGHVRYAHDFAARRRVAEGAASMNRLYVIESAPSPTGAIADHRWPVRSSQVEEVARALATRVGVAGVAALAETAIPADWLAALARDLQAHRGRSLVVAGDQQPPIVHALAHALNDALGNVGRTVVYTDPIEAAPVNQTESLRELVAAMNAGQVELLVIIGGNPAYTAPVDLAFADALAKVPFRVHLGLYADETAALCDWHVPQAHTLEAWGDVRAYDGTITIQQPLIAPLYGGKSAYELLSALLGDAAPTSHDIVRGHWEAQRGSDGFDQFWQMALHDGVVAGSALPPRAVTLSAQWPAATAVPEGLEIIFRPDPTIWDGAFANNGWLQELPKPLTKLTWDNVALVSPATAQRLMLANEQVIELTYRGRTLRAPVWIQPGHADEAITLYLGYGRTRAGHVGTGAGYNAYALRTADAPWFDGGLTVRATGERYALAGTQHHFMMEGRDLIRAGTLAEFQADPEFIHHGRHEAAASLYPPHPYPGYAWGLSIDLGACIGCNACVVACQAENNIPVVGKEQVARGREMHWIRIDHYFAGDLDRPEVYHQPVPCMHCENAPCEPVCPVAATVHSPEGLNEMTYNRCVGTRYCANNCPYKVRRFNFLQFTDYHTESLKLLNNPDVTVRARGVMEKCTYCVQRINTARIAAEQAGRTIADGEVVTACQQTCPTQAIVFGNINDPNSRIARRRASPLNYALLEELNTHPRTTYLARLRNPNPEIEGEAHV